MGYCDWALKSELDKIYHDTEWGKPARDDRTQFEFLMLEVMQCGLSWSLILRKREVFRKCFDDFDYDKIAKYTDDDVKRIMNEKNMIRSERKIRAIINNAARFKEIRQERGGFSEYIWSFSDNKTILYEGREKGEIPVSNGLSDKISADLKKRGFKYIGSITAYSHLQACGIINDHDIDCPCYKEIVENYDTVSKPKDKEKYAK